ncbi:MAG: MBOAT family protein [Desulfosarcinaceae bacterium]
MLFSSTLFLFAFLPVVILSYYGLKLAAGNRLRNFLLLVFSYLFYLFGTGGFVLLLIASTGADYILGLLLDRRPRQAKLWVGLSVVLNLGGLAYFKYAGFFVSELNRSLTALGLGALDWPQIVLPIGISFFTFQKMSYIIDVYRRHTRSMANFVDFALYVAMFPQLVAGPIVRFKDIWDQLIYRRESWDDFHRGALRFCWGLSKKVLIADACGRIADAAFGLDPSVLDTKTAWLGAVAYTLQIYFDFSAYSDMAIGLARLFGFELLENFQRPYAASSITDFWRRWHISLSRWFKDYLYIPLGGNRKSARRTYGNLLTVFCLCGLWHGANWTFLVWGLYHGFFLILERRAGWRAIGAGRWIWARRCLTMLVVVFGWVIFRSESLTGALAYLNAMVVPKNLPLGFELYSVLHLRNLFFFLVACTATLGAGALPTFEQLAARPGPVRSTLGASLVLVALPYCAIFILGGVDHPFIYFRF